MNCLICFFIFLLSFILFQCGEGATAKGRYEGIGWMNGVRIYDMKFTKIQQKFKRGGETKSGHVSQLGWRTE